MPNNAKARKGLEALRKLDSEKLKVEIALMPRRISLVREETSAIELLS